MIEVVINPGKSKDEGFEEVGGTFHGILKTIYLEINNVYEVTPKFRYTASFFYDSFY
jgi:hypothetical protein